VALTRCGVSAGRVVPGIAGAFFRDQALTVTIALTVSIFTAMLLQPMLSSRLLQIGAREKRGLFKLTDRGFGAFYGFYHGVLERALRRPVLMITLLVAGMAAAGLMGSRIERSLMPQRASGDMRLELEYPTGSPLEETTDAVADLGAWIQADPAVARVFTQVGTTERTLAAMKDYTAPNTARMRILVKPGRGANRDRCGWSARSASAWRWRRACATRFARKAAASPSSSRAARRPSPWASWRKTRWTRSSAAQQILDALAGSRRLSDLRADRVLDAPNIVVHLDTEEILRAGLDPDRIARDVRNRITGVEATTFSEVEKRIDIAVRFPQAEQVDLAGVLAPR
jgi:multidrug efflux pump subunit AcrB